MSTQTNVPQTVTEQLDELFALGVLPPAQKEHIYEQISETITLKTLGILTHQMNDEELNAWEAFIKTNPSEAEMFAYLDEHVPGYQQIMEEVAIDFMDYVLRVSYPELSETDDTPQPEQSQPAIQA